MRKYKESRDWYFVGTIPKYILWHDISFTRRGRGLTTVGALVFDKTISRRQLGFGETNKAKNCQKCSDKGIQIYYIFDLRIRFHKVFGTHSSTDTIIQSDNNLYSDNESIFLIIYFNN